MTLDSRHLDTAAEFCKVAGKSDLVEYLGLRADCTAEDAQEQLKRRRRYMQGMQSNPKYKQEALLLIKHFTVFNGLLGTPGEYLAESRKRAESAHMPVLEMTIRGALRGGPPSPQQVEFLKRNAGELGIGDSTFMGTLERLMIEAGHRPASMSGTLPTPSMATASTSMPPRKGPPPPPTVPSLKTLTPSTPSFPPTAQMTPTAGPLSDLDVADHYTVLGIARGSSRAEIRDAWQARIAAARNLAANDQARLVARYDQAWSVLADQTAREAYDLSRKSTGPPARDREVTDPNAFAVSPLHAPTAPPVRPRTASPTRRGTDDPGTGSTGGGPTRALVASDVPRASDVIEVHGNNPRQVKVTAGAVTVPLRLTFHGEGHAARVVTDAPWLTAHPSRIESARGDVEITIRIDPALMPRHEAVGSVAVQTDRGDRALISFEAERIVQKRQVPILPIVAIVVGLLFGTIILAWIVKTFVMSGAAA